MDLTHEHIKIAQTGLNKHYYQNLNVSGVVDEATSNALLAVSLIPTHWPLGRQLIGMIQSFAAMEGFEAGPIDGWWGPQTEQAYDELCELVNTGHKPETWRDDEGEGGDVDGGVWPLQTQHELIMFYGEVGTNQTKAVSPYPLKIAWDTSKTITKFSCHIKVKDSLEKVLANVLRIYGLDEIQRLGLDQWGGCLNVRKMRGGTKYSTHSWGCAIDWDPARNKLRWGANKANFARPDYEEWWKAWESEGWVSLGRAKNYDWMHVQATRVK